MVSRMRAPPHFVRCARVMVPALAKEKHPNADKHSQITGESEEQVPGDRGTPPPSIQKVPGLHH